MPTSRPRHMITETEPVQAALDGLRAELGDRRIDFAELVTLGANEKLRRLRADDVAAGAMRERLAQMILDGTTPGDPVAADDVKRHGLIERR